MSSFAPLQPERPRKNNATIPISPVLRPSPSFASPETASQVSPFSSSPNGEAEIEQMTRACYSIANLAIHHPSRVSQGVELSMPSASPIYTDAALEAEADFWGDRAANNQDGGQGSIHATSVKTLFKSDDGAGVEDDDADVQLRVVEVEEGIFEFLDSDEETTGDETDSALSRDTAGIPLPPSILTRMENLFGTSFADVRIHLDDPEVAASGALAFTCENDIYFAPGAYDPSTPEGLQLIGHELTHVVQQRQGKVHGPEMGEAMGSELEKLPAQAARMKGGSVRQQPTKSKRDRKWTKQEQYDLNLLKRKMEAANPLYIVEEWDFTNNCPIFSSTASIDPTTADAVEAFRTEDIKLPPNREARFPTDIKFATNDYRYKISLAVLGKDGKPTVPRATFKIKGTPAAQGSISAVGRAFQGRQVCYPNPAYVDPGGVVAAVQAQLQAAGHSVVANAAAVPATHSVTLPTPATQPFVVCLEPAPRHDSRQARQPADTRDVNAQTTYNNTVAAYQAAVAAGQPVPHHFMQAIVEQTHSPRTVRGGSGRDPQGTAGGNSASTVMGTSVPRAAQGTLTAHEYCHLVGDGDSGACAPNNLVIGSNQVNTEQLAMEEILRRFRPRLRKNGWSVGLQVHVLLSNAAPVNPVQAGKQGDWVNEQIATTIRYRIYIHPQSPILQRRGVTNDVDIWTQYMDAQRGTIPSAEVTMLQTMVKSRFEAECQNIESTANLQGAEQQWPASAPQYTGRV
jgi:hypothetical protein